MPPTLRSFIGCFSTNCLEDVGRQETRGPRKHGWVPPRTGRRIHTRGGTSTCQRQHGMRGHISAAQRAGGPMGMLKEGLPAKPQSLLSFLQLTAATRLMKPQGQEPGFWEFQSQLSSCSSFRTSLVSVSPSVKWVLLYLPLGYYDIWMLGHIIMITELNKT